DHGYPAQHILPHYRPILPPLTAAVIRRPAAILPPPSGGLLTACKAAPLALWRGWGWLPVARDGRWRGAGRLRRVGSREKWLCISYTLDSSIRSTIIRTMVQHSWLVAMQCGRLPCFGFHKEVCLCSGLANADGYARRRGSSLLSWFAVCLYGRWRVIWSSVKALMSAISIHTTAREPPTSTSISTSTITW